MKFSKLGTFSLEHGHEKSCFHPHGKDGKVGSRGTCTNRHCLVLSVPTDVGPQRTCQILLLTPLSRALRPIYLSLRRACCLYISVLEDRLHHSFYIFKICFCEHLLTGYPSRQRILARIDSLYT